MAEMADLVHIEEIMRKRLNEELYQHSLGVAQTASLLAGRYGVEARKAYLTGLVHDFGKSYTPAELRRLAERKRLALDWVALAEPKLLHAPVGAALLAEEFGISDPQIVRAVALHTTGGREMNLFDKVIYLADVIEPGRSYSGVEEIREAAFKDLESALLLAVNNTIRSVLARDMLLHPDSIEFRNSLLAAKKGMEGG
ncbi:MAG TPA: bis(5'-nucleosyl)-tetraphosphatase (symmetrical) YqeK [Bacillota bacterium]|jgi:predicted HD superfamily hydrolase involved in NAD metabolism|nr:HD domain-containing protein [Bacillota bacterium]HOB87272.1 bis(5'-nucleosyl)-tetraphosphatase (symmetrical) YqeK [Bacillota bacterium]HOP69924.1 bis(5'-nucleosyl)-tetraphosphatase (symmetrical) YqeK [Bacillota bacterium]HPT34089.1 bis(5'-nucleosyl)-tetraphosphatase (symmetrical) YqeK [Bacillota bacterium]HPZ64752.1 bis(5'-nucleosyl)-tetraphosphatase (symmetrical) YqeK [Bacillota bacterium]